jgi:signal transduction histidine kinase
MALLEITPLGLAAFRRLRYYNPFMSEPTIDPRWAELFSVMVHDVRTPMTVVAGYVDMLMKERFGPLTDKQRQILEEVQKSCGRVSTLLKEGSELTSIERKTTSIHRRDANLRDVLRAAIAQLPPLPDREVHVDLQTGSGDGAFRADAPRLANAFSALIAGLRREVVTTDRLLVRERPTGDGFEIRIGDEETVATLDGASITDLPIFNEWRGGSGMSLAVARRILNAHGGHLVAPPDGRKSGALVLFRG